MPDDLQAPNGTGRAINTTDLELFGSKLENRFDRLDDKLDRIDAWQTERDGRIDRNAADIKELRDWKHEHINRFNDVSLRTEPLTVSDSSFLHSHADMIRVGVDVLKKIDVSTPLDKHETDRLRALLQQIAEEDLEFLKDARRSKEQRTKADTEVQIGRRIGQLGAAAIFLTWLADTLASHFHWL